MKLADIVVFGFNRPENLISLFESLSKCKLASDSVVYLLIDGPRSEEDSIQIGAIKEHFDTTSYDFQEFNIRYSNSNRGLALSLISGVTEAFKLNDKVIVLEDDLLLTSDFLVYMNKSLDFYNDYKEVGSISGYSIDIDYKLNSDNFFHPRPCSWGWGTWKDRWLNCDWDYNPNGLLEKFFLWKKTRIAGEDVYRMFTHNQKKIINSWAIRWTIDHLNRGLLTSYPVKSKVINNGFDDPSATHCKKKNPFPSQLYDEAKNEYFFNKNVFVDLKLLRKYNFYYSNIYKFFFKVGFLLFKR